MHKGYYIIVVEPDTKVVEDDTPNSNDDDPIKPNHIEDNNNWNDNNSYHDNYNDPAPPYNDHVME